MIRGATRTRPPVLGALFAFLTALVVTLFGVVPPSAATTRQPGAAGDAAAAAPGDSDLGASVSSAVPDDTGDDIHVPGPIGTPAAELPEQPTHRAIAAAALATPVEPTSPETPRGRAPPR